MRAAELTPQSRMRVARAAGGAYVAFIAASIVATAVGSVGLSDAQSTLDAATSDPGRFRVGVAVAMVADLLFLLAAWLLMRLLSPAGRDTALLFFTLNAVGAAIHVTGLALLAGALWAGADVGGVAEAQRQAAAWLAVDLSGTMREAAQLFFGAWLFPLGVLVIRSRVIPRVLGYLLLADGVAVLFWFTQAMLLPDMGALSYPAFAVSFVAELGLGAWLLWRGAAEAPAVGSRVAE